jgi:hypothetical protein
MDSRQFVEKRFCLMVNKIKGDIAVKPKIIPLGIVLIVFLCIATCGGCIGGLNLNKMIVENQQHYLYCELLRPNMKREEVRDILSKCGSFQEYESHINNWNDVSVVYDNLFTSYRFGGETILYFKQVGCVF